MAAIFKLSFMSIVSSSLEKIGLHLLTNWGGGYRFSASAVTLEGCETDTAAISVYDFYWV